MYDLLERELAPAGSSFVRTSVPLRFELSRGPRAIHADHVVQLADYLHGC
jgi:hypothetical protein